MMNEKKQYTAPELTVHGDVAQITQATHVGGHFDGNYTAGQPIPNSGPLS